MASIFIGAYQQGSREVLDYSMNWGTAMTAESDSVSSSQWHVESGNATLGNDSNGAPSPAVSGDVTTVWIVNGTIGDIYHITNVVTTAGGRKLESSFKVTIIDK